MLKQEIVLLRLSDSLPKPVKRIDTHAAIVLLSGERAIKIKRNVRYSYLDYSTLERRKEACEREFEVNRRFAPQLYLRVVPIRIGADEKVMVDTINGPIVEWAIEMRRFDEDEVLENRCKRGPIVEEMARKVARSIWKAHKDAAEVPALGWPDSLRSTIVSNCDELVTFEQLFAHDRVQALANNSLARYERVHSLLKRRARCGSFRECHGDLHLGNIVLINDEPVLFDALEFDQALAATDTLYDLAFVLMDLLLRDQRQAASVVLNEYIRLSRNEADLEGLAALPVFMSIRAAIRAKVTASRLPFAEKAERARLESDACRYFELADRLLVEPRGALVAIGGLSGTGKSALARALAPLLLPEPGAILLQSDFERKAHFNMRGTERLPATAYDEATSAIIYRNLCRQAQAVLTAGCSVIVDATFANEQERHAIEHVAASLHVPFTGVFLTADLTTRLERVTQRRNDLSDADEEVVRQQERCDLGAVEWPHINASGDFQEALRAVKRAYLVSKDPAY